MITDAVKQSLNDLNKFNLDEKLITQIKLNEIDFIAERPKNSTLISDKLSDSIDIYKDKNDIDADDNGHYTIFTIDGRMTNGSGEYIE